MSKLRHACDLPPLILHPFSRHTSPDQLVEQARAALMLHEAIAGDGRSREELNLRVLEARFQEMRMLYYLGKDLFRWIAQCVESTAGRDLNEQSFADFLVKRPPETVRAKLRSWGVADHAAIFSRSIGLKALFREPPDLATLEAHFILNYHGYADGLFTSFQESERFTEVEADDFHFELYGSGEYSRMLESQWGGSEA